MFFMMDQIRDDGFDRGQGHAIYPRLTGRDLHRLALEQHARMNAVDAWPSLHIVEHDILDLRLETKHPLAWLEWEFFHITLQGQPHIVGIAGLDPVLEPVDRSITDCLGQVTIHCRAIGAGQMDAQIDDAGLAGKQLIAPLGRAGRVGIGESSLTQR